MNDDMQRLGDWVAPLLEKMEPAERRKLAREIAKDVTQSQRLRIKAQRNPDGSKYEPRSTKKGEKQKNKPVRFMYKKPGGDERVASMKSYRDEGFMLTGYDRVRNAIRSFRKDRIRYFMPPPPGGGSLRSQKGSIRRGAMYSKIRQAKHLKSKASPEAVIVGFSGQVASIARVHQYGLRDRVAPKGPKVDYPERRLLGFTDQDILMIQDKLLERFEPKK